MPNIDEENRAGSLAGTLPAGGLSLDQSSLSLPDIDIKSLGADELLALSLRQMAQLAQREGRVTGTAAISTFFSERGIQPEDLPGGSIAQMLAVVDNAMVDPVVERGQSIADMINAVRSSRDQIRDIAEEQINFLVKANAWNTISNSQRQSLWEGAGYSGIAPLVTKEKDELTLSSYFSPDQLRQIRRAGINLDTPEGIQAAFDMFPSVPESEQWDSIESFIDANISAGNVSLKDMAEIFAESKKNTNLSDSDIRAIMSAKGMNYDSILGWKYSGESSSMSPAGQDVVSGGLLNKLWGSPLMYPTRKAWEFLTK